MNIFKLFSIEASHVLGKFFLRTILLIALSIGLIHNNIAQIQSDFYENIVPEASEAAKFGTFGNTPIDYYTGTPNISIPLFALKSHHLELPIGISYDASGVKINSDAGWVGQNWNLSAGGYVARIMHGLPDELPEIGYLTTVVETNNYVFENNDDAFWWLDRFETKEKDTQPDEFVVSLPGRSIKFVIDRYGNPQCIPHQQVKISFVKLNDKINEFVITMENGTKYTFGQDVDAIEETEIENKTSKYHYESDGYAFFDRDFFNANREFFYPAEIESPTHLIDIKDHADYQAFDERSLNEETDETDVLLEIEKFNSKWYLVKIEDGFNDYIDFDYSPGEEVSNNLPARTTEIRPVLSYGTTDVLLLERTHSYTSSSSTYTAMGGGIYSDYNDDGHGNPLLDYIVPPHSSVNGHETHNWDPVNPWFENRSNELMRCYSYIEGVGIRTVAKFGETELGSAPDREDLYQQVWDDYHVYEGIMVPMPPLVKNFNYDLTGHESFKYSEVYPNGGGKIVSKATNTVTTKLIKSITTKSGSKITFNFDQNGMNEVMLYNNESTLVDHFKLDYSKYANGRVFLDKVSRMGRSTKKVSAHEFKYRSPQGLPGNESSEVDNYGYYKSDGKRGTLYQVFYPTGGYTEYIYDFNNGNRIKEIKDFSSVAKLTGHRKLEYPSPILVQEPVTVSYQNIKIQGTNDYLKYEIKTNHPQNYLLTTRGSYVGNSIVKEYLVRGDDEQTADQGYIEHHFTTSQSNLPSDDVISCANVRTNIDEHFNYGVTELVDTNIFPFPKPTHNDHLQGLPTAKYVYDQAGNKISEETYSYKLNPHNYDPVEVRGYIGGKFDYEIPATRDYWYGTNADPKDKLRLAWPAYKTDWVVMDKKTTTTYEQANDSKAIASTTEYTYRPDGDKNMIEEKTILADDSEHTRIINYPYDYCQVLQGQVDENSESGPMERALVEMCLENQISQPVEVINIVDGKVISSILSTFKVQNNMRLIDEVYQLETDAPIVYSPGFDSRATFTNLGGGQFSTTFEKNENYKQLVKLSYDNYGNLIQTISSDGINTTYDYGYNNTLVTSMTKGGQTTTYEHLPVVGVTKVTDPNGQFTTYEYDEFNRLKNIKDHNGDITEHFRYNYGGQYDLSGKSLGINCPWPGNTDFIEVPSGFFVPYGEVEYVWDYGEGTVIETTENEIPSYGYAAEGTYTLSVTRTSGQFYDSQTIDREVNVENGTIEIVITNQEAGPKDHQYVIDFGTSESKPECNVIETYKWFISRDNGNSYTYSMTNPTFQILTTFGNWVKLEATSVDGRVWVDEYQFNTGTYMDSEELATVDITHTPDCIMPTVPITFNTSKYIVTNVPEPELKWDFGDGSPVVTNNHANPQEHIYTAAGTYTVSLEVLYYESGSQEYFTITKPVVVNSNDNVATYLNKVFDTIEKPGGGTKTTSVIDLHHTDIHCIDQIEWVVDGVDGMYIDETQIALLTNDAEIKSVSAIIHDISGASFTTETINVGSGSLDSNYLTQAELNAVDIDILGSCYLKEENIGFTLSEDLNLPHTTNIKWDFGDGTITEGTAENASHAYTSGGTFQVKATISNVFYEEVVIAKNITILSNAGKGVSLAGDYAEAPHGGGNMYALFAASHSINCVDRYEWFANDDTVPLATTTDPQLGQVLPVYELGEMRVEVVDQVGARFVSNQVSYGNSDYLTQAQLDAMDFTVNTSCKLADKSISFSLDGTLNMPDPTTLTWNFGDGTGNVADNSGSINHTFSSGGTKTVTLTIDNPYYTNKVISKNITIQTNNGKSVSLSGDYAEAPHGGGNFYATFTPSNTISCVDRYEWFMNEDENPIATTTDPFLGQVIPVYEQSDIRVEVIDQAGERFVSNTVSQGNSDFMTQQEFDGVSLNASSSCYVTDNNVSFSFSESVNLAGTSTVTWDYGDGSSPVQTSSFSNQSHSYADPGTYTITATISNIYYDNRTISETVTIKDIAPFTVRREVLLTGPTFIEYEFSAEPINESFATCGGLSYVWQFNNGSGWQNVSTAQTFSQVGGNGDQVRLLSVTDNQGITYVITGGTVIFDVNDQGPASGSGEL